MTRGGVSSHKRLVAALPRPLDRLHSVKLKIGIVVVLSVAAAIGVFTAIIGWFPPLTTVIAFAVALVVTQLVAHGMTSPLREMTAAARAMARGDYSRRVRATSRDEVGELARAFNHMAADLAAADQQRRELIANVSHELRTPITALQAMLENIVDGVAEADPDTLRTALGQTERLGRLVAELLDLSRIDAGVLALDLELFEVAPLLAEVVAEAEVTAATAGREVRFTASVAPPDGYALADRARLSQVLVNLLDNAARHSPPGGEVALTVRAGAEVLSIEVRDEGPGIAPEDRHRVFERFTRGERATGGGTGLGLAIARWVVDLHRGTVAVLDSDRGCRIRVSLPAGRLT